MPKDTDSAATSAEANLSWSEKWRQFPKTVFPIFGNEFCERFSYYGMRTVLTLYLVNILRFDSNLAVSFYHLFIVVCYTMPLFGSILADGYVGKFKTIIYLSLVYALGNILLAIAAFCHKDSSVHPYLDLLGLLTIGIGTGGIKPCVSAFGGDQFVKGQERMLSVFFSVFYFCINAGSLISHFITPIIRVTPCNGESTCYPVAFGVPACLMVVATILFLIGSPWYRKKPPSDNVIGQVFHVVKVALGNKSRSEEKKPHFLDFYLDTHKCLEDPRCDKFTCHKAAFIDDVKALFRVCIMYLPVPIFWALFDQQVTAISTGIKY